jgi:hypothetical protein
MAPQTQGSSESKIPAWAGVGNSEADSPMFEELALLAPTIVPDDEHGVIRFGDSASRILDNSALVIERKIEMLNIFLVSLYRCGGLWKGYEQHNRYVIMNPKGEHIGYFPNGKFSFSYLGKLTAGKVFGGGGRWYGYDGQEAVTSHSPCIQSTRPRQGRERSLIRTFQSSSI